MAFLAEPAPLLVTKANIRSRVHRRAYMDYIGVKLYDTEGATSGELRIVGLFTSMSLRDAQYRCAADPQEGHRSPASAPAMTRRAMPARR